MLQAIIEDFQSIEKAKLKIEGFTLILGQSNQGKSATLRALKAACTNRFKAGQVRHGQDHAMIQIKTPESQAILRCMRPWNGSIKYKLGDELFSKVGRTLPKQINEFLNLGFLETGSENYSLNFHDQFQPPLLLAFSQAKVMELLSVSTALNDLKETKEALMIKRQENKGALATIQAIKDEAVEKVHSLEEKVKVLEPIVVEFNKVQDVIDSIESQMDKISSIEDSVKLITSLEKKIEILEDIGLIESNLQTTESILVQVKQLSGCLATVIKVSSKIQLHEEIVTTFDNDLESKFNALTDLLVYNKTYQDCSAKIKVEENRLSLLQEASSLAFVDDRATHSTIYALESAIEQLGTIESRINELKNITEEHICPFCGSKVE